MATQVYILEDHDVMREALAEFITGETSFEVWGTAGSAEQALDDLAEASEVELVLVDTRLPEMNGIEFVTEINRQRPELKCVMLSGHDEETYVEKALEAGAKGYIVKGNPSEISIALERVLDGEVYLSNRQEETEMSEEDT